MYSYRIIIISSSFKAVLNQRLSVISKNENTRDHIVWTIREQGSHVRGEHLTQ